MLKLFDMYFLILVLVSGLVVRVVDYNRYKCDKQDVLRKKAKLVSDGIMILAILLFIMGKTID